MSQVPRAAERIRAEGSCFIVGQDPKGHWLAFESHNRSC